jgi:eukaryotic-like serine/threonine-protein kinase
LPAAADDEMNRDKTKVGSSIPSIPDTEFVNLSRRADGASLARSLSSSVDEFPPDVPRRIGEYTLQRLIGEGGMGRVFLAEHVRMQRLVALKVLPTERTNDLVWVRRFYDEIRVASKLLHPNIVTAFDAGESAGIHYLAMEYIDGVTLSTAVEHSGPMPLGEVAGIIRQSAMGLLHAHRAGVIHRDVKPGNIMRAVDGSLKVLDVGLAYVSQQQWSVGSQGGDAVVPSGAD